MTTIALRDQLGAPFLELTKPRIVALVLVTIAAGYVMASPPGMPALGPLLHTLLGAGLVAGGTNALNQVLERDVDALMRRTARRPLPSGRLGAPAATVFAWSLGLAGVTHLALAVNITTASLAAATLVSYVFFYTPLKRRTPLATLVGAVPGALPIVGGWTAAGGALGAEALVLFWILFLWQLPHFLALSWLYRDDYARAGLRMPSVGDADGSRTFDQALLQSAALVPVSLAPTLLGMSGVIYFAGAAGVSGWLLWTARRAARLRTTAAARKLFLVTLAYLPALLVLLLLDRTAP
ncbi:MAG TPA: heme o synthase [Gemmatimonadaceae bacterium]|nr:heme o synthase [Gemmatimonadaceae bacterium]